MSDKYLRELCLNFKARMVEAQLHEKYRKGPIFQTEVNTRMIEFFTGAYVALRTMGKENEAREVGVFTKTTLAPLGYLAMLRTIEGVSPLQDNAVLIERPKLN